MAWRPIGLFFHDCRGFAGRLGISRGRRVRRRRDRRSGDGIWSATMKLREIWPAGRGVGSSLKGNPNHAINFLETNQFPFSLR